MSVVINDFEIVTETPPTTSPDTPEAEAAVSPSSLRPRDVEAIIERAEQRRRRVRAH